MIIDELRDLRGGIDELNELKELKELKPGIAQLQRELNAVREEVSAMRQGYVRRGNVPYINGSLDDTAGAPEEGDEVKPKRQAVEQMERKVQVLEVIPRQRPHQSQTLSRTGSYEEEDRGRVGEIAPEVIGDVGELSIPIEHTTAAQKLLRWPSIQELFSRNGASYDENYVMELEETRGLLRVYGRGEGVDLKDGGQPGPSSPAPSTGSVKSEDQAFDPSTPPEGLWGTPPWGTGFGSPGSGDGRRTYHEDVGGLNRDGSLKIDPQTCYGLVKSYMDNIHILHPFLDKNTLSGMVNRFARRYNPADYPSMRSPFASSNIILPSDGRRDSAATLNKAMKRKHSSCAASGTPTDSSSGVASSTGVTHFRPMLERSISTALILLVLALGKICEWKDPLPGPVPDPKPKWGQQTHQPYSPAAMQVDSPLPMAMRQSPTTSQSSVYRTVASPNTGLRQGGQSRRSSDGGISALESGTKNVDVIPGLAYYAFATDILGNLHGGNDLTYIQANLLAGLYAGQLARVFESWSWINSACRACQVLVRP